MNSNWNSVHRNSCGEILQLYSNQRNRIKFTPKITYTPFVHFFCLKHFKPLRGDYTLVVLVPVNSKVVGLISCFKIKSIYVYLCHQCYQTVVSGVCKRLSKLAQRGLDKRAVGLRVILSVIRLISCYQGVAQLSKLAQGDSVQTVSLLDFAVDSTDCQ